MREIDDARYSFRKQLVYDDDFAVLFYKGNKVAKGSSEMFRYSWYEDAYDYKNVGEFFLYGIGVDERTCLDTEDAKESWVHIWNALTWNDSSKSYKYSNWELVILDI